MKKSLIMSIVALMVISLCTVAFAAFQPDSKTTVYRGEEWHFDIEEKEYPYITVIPKDRKEPQVYDNGYVGKVEPKQKQYEIILLGK